MIVKDIEWTYLDSGDGRWFGGIGNWKPFFIERKSYHNQYVLYCCLVYRQELASSTTLEEAKDEASHYMQAAIRALPGKELRWEKDTVLDERYFGFAADFPLYMVRLDKVTGSWTAAQYPVGFNGMIVMEIDSRDEAMAACQIHFRDWVRTLFKAE